MCVSIFLFSSCNSTASWSFIFFWRAKRKRIRHGGRGQRKTPSGPIAPRAQKQAMRCWEELDWAAWADFFDRLQKLIGRYRAYAGRKVRRDHGLCFSN